MICKLTGKEGKPANAHIIPKSFYFIDPHDKPIKLVPSDEQEYPKRAPIGVYDSTIVTKEGEKYFQKYDDYAYTLLVHNFHNLVPHDDPASGIKMVYSLRSYNYHDLKLFFISMLWRAGASSHQVFSNVILGPHLNKLKEAILNDDPKSPHDYAVCLAIFDDVKYATIMSPFKFRFKDTQITTYKFYFGNFVAFIKVDNRPFDEELKAVQLTPNKPLVIVRLNYKGSNEYGLAKKLASRVSF